MHAAYPEDGQNSVGRNERRGDMSKERFVKQITEYLNGELEGDALQNFENEMSVDAEFRQLVEEDRLIREGVQLMVLEKTKRELQELEKELSGSQSRKKTTNVISLRRWMGWTAAAVVLIALGWWVLFDKDQVTHEDLYAAYFEPEPNLFHPEQRGGEELALIDRAFQAYDYENHEQAIRLFEDLLKERYDASVQFYLGVSYLADENPDKALKALNDFLKNSQDMQNEAKWFMALAHLKSGEIDKTREQLEVITKTKNSKTSQAVALMKQLKDK